MRELLLATKNPGKFREISEALSGVNVRLVFLGDLDVSDKDFEENGETFADNAHKKAKYYAEKTGLLTLAEDSGILVDSLMGELGVKTRRWGAGEEASDEEWIGYFMRRMEGVSNRTACFVCSACLIDGGRRVDFEGETEGVITDKLMAPILKGLPLSSCFMANGCKKVYAALSAEEKNDISHRGKAISKVKDWLLKNS